MSTPELDIQRAGLSLWNEYTTKKMECEDYHDHLQAIAGLIQDYEEGELQLMAYVEALREQYEKLNLKKLGLA